jgi:hypothetical protein
MDLRVGLVLLMLTGCAAPPSTLAAPPAPTADEEGAASADRRDWEERPDFAALRAAYSDRADFGAVCEARPVRDGFAHLAAERWTELAALTGPWTQSCPVDMDAHMLRAIALDATNRAEEAEHHRVWARGLFEAVLATGDGKTPQTPMRVIAVFEEYSMLRVFGWEAKRQALTTHGLDAMTVLVDGEERVVYFDPAASFERMRRRLEGDASGE